MRSHDVLCHSVIERVILSASDSLDHCTQVVSLTSTTILYMCLPLNNFNLNILFYCSSIMLLLTLHIFITHLMAKYLSF